MSLLKQHIGERVRLFRESLGKNQREFSEMLVIKQQSLSKYENGTLNIPDKQKISILKYGVNLVWLLTGEGSMLSIPKTVGKRLSFIRNDLGMDQEGWAEEMGLSVEELTLFESDLKKPSQDYLKKLETSINLNSHWVLTGDGSTQLIKHLTVKEPADFTYDAFIQKQHDFKKAFPGVYDIWEENQELKQQTGTGCEVCDVVHHLNPDRTMKLKGYAEALLHEQEIEEAGEANHRAG